MFKEKKQIVFLVSILLLGFLTQFSEAVPTREILNSNRKNPPEQKNTEIAKLCDTSSIISPIKTLITTIPNALISIIGNLTGNGTSGLGSLFMKPGGGGGLSKNGTISTCKPIDPVLIANLPGVFIAVPIVIIGIAILIGIIAAIVIAIGGLGGELTKNAYDMKHSDDQSGYAPSVMPMYGTPVSSYGSPSITGSSSYSRLAQNVDTATHDFNQAYDKYSGLLSEPKPQQQQQQQSPSTSYIDNQNQYFEDWKNNIVMKRMKQ